VIANLRLRRIKLNEERNQKSCYQKGSYQKSTSKKEEVAKSPR